MPKNVSTQSERIKSNRTTLAAFIACAVMAVLLAVVLSGCSSENEEVEDTTWTTTPSASERTNTNTFDVDEHDYADVSDDEDAALERAQAINDENHFSKQALYDFLTSYITETFSPDAAQYAVDNVDADWNENALITAQYYMDEFGMDTDEIYEQLTATSVNGDKFTEDEATYAIDNLQSEA
ncbi:MAG: Ltp family lipoprotein [Eggerthellaceae bacterium]|nr:Ltp family lipoprotein [Eggerthellaceae bacterium]